MTLPEAVKRFESQFKSVETTDALPDVLVVYSGGVVPPKDIAPALYSTEEAAFQAWLETAIIHAGTKAVLKWMERPELLKFDMTMMDRKQMHRAVSIRYTVKSRFEVK